MGWSFQVNPTSKKTYVAQVLRGWNQESRYTVLDSSIQGNELWLLLDYHTPVEGTDEPAGILIAVVLFEKQNGCWGHTDFFEEQYPYYFKCPASFLQRAPVKSEAWRANVRHYHEEKQRTAQNISGYAIGARIRLKNCREGLTEAQIVDKRKNTWIGVANDGRTYRLPKRVCGEVLA